MRIVCKSLTHLKTFEPLFSIFYCTEYRCSGYEQKNRRVPGAIRQPKIKTFDDCKRNCNPMKACIGLNWDSASSTPCEIVLRYPKAGPLHHKTSSYWSVVCSKYLFFISSFRLFSYLLISISKKKLKLINLKLFFFQMYRLYLPFQRSRISRRRNKPTKLT